MDDDDFKQLITSLGEGLALTMVRAWEAALRH
jgi:hypothetical protein